MSTPVLRRRDADPAHEGTPERVGIAESAGAGHLLQGDLSRFEKAADGIDPHVLDIDGRGQAGLGPEHPCEVTRAHPGSRGEPLDAVILGLMPGHSSAEERFEVDGANAARAFLTAYGVPEADVYTVWTAIALHTTPDIPVHMHPVVALVTAGVEMDVLGLTYGQYTEAERTAVVAGFPRTPHFKEDIIQAFYDGIRHKPDTTFGNVKADVVADKEPAFRRGNFCSVIRNSRWADGRAAGCGCGSHA